MLKFVVGVLCILSLGPGIFAQKGKAIEIVPSKGYEAISLRAAPDLASILNDSVSEVIKSYPGGKLKEEEIAATLIDLRDPSNIKWASFRGDQPIYPASVVKMFYMAALHQQIQDGKVTMTTELQRGLKDMIVDSSNEATQYILDVLTNTSSGAELPLAEFEKWQYKRNRVNRFYSSMGYTGINVNQKTFCEDAYGIEQQSRAYKGQNRNMLTTNATARLLAEIVLSRAVNADRSRQMMELLKRDPFKESKDTDNQGTGFTGKVLITRKMTGAKLWSKAGWTSRARHDAAYIETPDGLKFVLVVFTENHANEHETIPAVAGNILDRLSGKQLAISN
jgi:beta-lactamase class A